MLQRDVCTVKCSSKTTVGEFKDYLGSILGLDKYYITVDGNDAHVKWIKDWTDEQEIGTPGTLYIRCIKSRWCTCKPNQPQTRTHAHTLQKLTCSMVA